MFFFHLHSPSDICIKKVIHSEILTPVQKKGKALTGMGNLSLLGRLPGYDGTETALLSAHILGNQHEIAPGVHERPRETQSGTLAPCAHAGPGMVLQSTLFGTSTLIPAALCSLQRGR